MTTELEKQFFDTFGIEPNTTGYELKQVKENTRGLIRVPVSEYPQITDKQYLELIVLLSGVCCMNFAFERSLDEMKYKILKITMEFGKILKHQVQAIFEGER